jgi:hypothetical protein
MLCRLCNAKLAPLRSLTDGEFCCDEHRQSFYQEQARIDSVVAVPAQSKLISLHDTIAGVAPELGKSVIHPDTTVFPLEVAVPSGYTSGAPSNDRRAGLPDATQLLPLYFEQHPASPGTRDAAASEAKFPDEPNLPEADLQAVAIEEEMPASDEVFVHPSRDILGSWRWIREAWRTAPTDLRTMALLIPVLLAVAVSGSVPKVKIPPVGNGAVQQLVNERFKNLHQSISNRAAVAFADDFRSGLDAWDSKSNLTTSWSYDAAGFVQPGPLAIFKPTIEMSDYRFEFLGEIDQRGMGCAFRAADLQNFYAVKFVVVKPGPLPLVHLVRYAVIDGKEGPHVEKPLPITVRKDMLYRVLLDVRGADYTIMAQGQVVDFWSDNQLRRGGVGFFCNRGEKARVRWVEVSHQYDTLGRLCAYLAPLGIEGRNGNFN